ncbi:DUF4259 domain-containing protein [Longispora fulva]|uniref:Uncharacterized protein n=1 Tax=Longispora fulva TaxID=619741 RepID=A0A8J7G6B3_9ACTN|nr:DUF4259 domain-containing protein [Longispora fulva]MBG6134493.1 hypothetical protein [Longispora fulva]
MGTFGVGLFDSDGAQDLLDDLAALSSAERVLAVTSTLSGVVTGSLTWNREVFPDEVVALAGLVAASLPGGRSLKGKAKTSLPTPGPDLIGMAVEALALASDFWMRAWVHAADAAEARENLNDLRRVLLAPA